MLTLVYAAFTGLGCLYVLMAAFLGHASDFGGGHDAGVGAAGGGHAAAGGAFAGHAGALGHAGSPGHAGSAGHAAVAGHAGPSGHAGPPGHADPSGHAAPGHHAGRDARGGQAGHPGAHAASLPAARFRFPLLSPLALATLVAALGAWGLIAKFGLGAGDGASLALAVPAAGLTAYGVTWIGWRLVSGSRGTSLIYREDLVGALAEITVPIPAGGVGEAVADAGGQRYVAPAREASGREVARGATVVILDASGTALLVRASPVLSPSLTTQTAAPAQLVQDGPHAAPATQEVQGGTPHA